MSRVRVRLHNSIGFKLSAIIAAVIFLSIAALSILNAQQSLNRETESYRELIRGAASAYSAAVADAVVARERAQTYASLRGVRELPNVEHIDITLSNGTVFAELGSGAWIITEGENERSLWQTDHIRVDLPIMKSGNEIGRLGMLVSIAPLRAEILSNLIVTLITSLVVSLLGILIAQFTVARITAPIRSLTLAMTGYRAGEDNHGADLRRRKDETGVLTQSFQDMVERIAERDQQIAHHVETLEDTVEERTSDLRVAKEEAEAANAAKSDFLATMSHEIRTPMNGMMVMAEMLGAADLTPRHRRYAEIIHRSGNSLLTIINDILDLSKIEAGQLDLESIPVAPENLAADVTSLFWERARGKDLDLALYVSPNVPQEILADPTRLNQVISNLVNNALKFTDRGGVLIRVDAEDVGDQACRMVFEIIDTGIGIPEDKIDHIFESFSQADQTTTRRFGGTGLGLSVCQRLVTAMEGEIEVRSSVGHGSKFRVTFPVPVSRAKPDSNSAGLTVGIDLPDGLARMSLEQSLKDLGCEISTDRPVFWLSHSDSETERAEPRVLLTDIGDTQADALLQSGQAVDSLHTPCTRAEMADLLARAQSGTFRGAEAIQGSAGPKALRSFEGLRILAADDNAVNREVLREALVTLKADAVFVEDGAGALDAYKAADFDLVFMDGSMPVMDGFEATREIRAFEDSIGRSRTPIFALTAQVAGTSGDAWEQAGADGHVLKPFTLDKLSEVLDGLDAAPAQATDTPAQTCAPDLLDETTISTLEQLGDGEGGIRDKVWSMFIDKAPGMLTQLLALMDGDDSDAIATQAHAFKSMALSSGLSGLADALQRLEALAKEDDTTARSPELKSSIADMLDSTRVAMADRQARAA